MPSFPLISRTLLWLVAAGLVACVSGPSLRSATVVSVKDGWLHYDGRLDVKANRRARDLLERYPETRGLHIDSVGGDVQLGMDLGSLVHNNNLDVKVTGMCFSSCALYVFPAGQRKLLGPEATLGWHAGSPQVVDAGELCGRGMPLSERTGLVFELCRESVMQWAAREQGFYEALGVDLAITWAGAPSLARTPPDGMTVGWTYSLSDLEGFGLRGIEVEGGDWRPQLQRDRVDLCVWDVASRRCLDVASPPPNFLIIVADDLGFSDLGVMGSEIRTPHLDALAEQGLLLTDFYVSPTCSPTRAMLLTGVDTHPAGLGTMSGEWSEDQEGQPGYEGVLSDRVVTVATLLRDAGYHTVLSGKWHLGAAPDQWPIARGFERSFGPARGGASHFSDQLSMFFPGEEGRPKTLFIDDDQPVTQLPDDYYSSAFFTDKLIEQIEQGRSQGKPFFAMATYTAPHWPLQVPDDWLDRYRGVYDEGWDVLRERRFSALQERGLVPGTARPPDRLPFVPAWSGMDADDRALAARKMEIYAAMVENLDHHIGRLLDHLEDTDQLDNTVVVFFSDNGAEGNPINRIVDDHGWVERTFDNRLENLGRLDSYAFTGPGWAQASTAAFPYFKSFTTEGGVRTPAIIAGPAVLRQGQTDAWVSVKDITPTLLDLAGVDDHGGEYRGRAVAPIEGRSMAAFLANASRSVHDETEVMGWELFGRRALRKGEWKIVWLYEPYGPGRWQLFHLARDPMESDDVAIRYPERLADLVAEWEAYAERNGVILPASDAGYAREDDWR